MQAVSDRWYIFYSRIATTWAVLFVLWYVAGWFIPTITNINNAISLTIVVFGVVVAQLLYTVIAFNRVVARTGFRDATLIIAMCNVLTVLTLMHTNGGFVSWYLIPWIGMTFIGGMFGAQVILGGPLTSGAYFLLVTSDGLQSGEPFDPKVLGGLGVSLLASAASYFFWRRRYAHSQNLQVAQLSGMVKTKQQQSEILIQSLADGVIVINPDGKIGLINPVAAAMTGWSVEEATGLDVSLVAKLQQENGAAIDESQNPFSFTLNQGAPSNATLQLIGKDNKQTVVSIVTSPVIVPKSGAVAAVVAVLRDVSVAHKEEKQRADFISTASHEMRTPVAAIEGYLALALNEKVSRIDSKARSYLEKAHESTQHLGKLFQDLLTSAKAEDGRLVSHPTAVELGAYIEQLSEGFRFAAQKKGLLSEFVIGSSQTSAEKVVRPLYYVNVDPDRLREVITNLFDNAVKYTPNGKITLGLTGNADVVQIFVRDTGPGIPQEDIPHLFQKFYRVDNSATRTIGGTGLGLFICRKIIELYHGRIWVESPAGQGSTFYINLPRLSQARATELLNSQQLHIPEPITSLTTPV